ncbi:MAG TPA: hypothetical protein ACQGQH_04280 [Xylella sp.]
MSLMMVATVPATTAGDAETPHQTPFIEQKITAFKNGHPDLAVFPATGAGPVILA